MIKKKRARKKRLPAQCQGIIPTQVEKSQKEETSAQQVPFKEAQASNPASYEQQLG